MFVCIVMEYYKLGKKIKHILIRLFCSRMRIAIHKNGRHVVVIRIFGD